MLVFVEEGKPEYHEVNPRSRDKNQQQTQPTYAINSGNQTRATLVEVNCALTVTVPSLVLLEKLQSPFRNS